MAISKELMNYVSDADLHTKMEHIDYSTNLRDVVTINYMLEHYEE